MIKGTIAVLITGTDHRTQVRTSSLTNPELSESLRRQTPWRWKRSFLSYWWRSNYTSLTLNSKSHASAFDDGLLNPENIVSWLKWSHVLQIPRANIRNWNSVIILPRDHSVITWRIRDRVLTIFSHHSNSTNPKSGARMFLSIASCDILIVTNPSWPSS